MEQLKRILHPIAIAIHATRQMIHSKLITLALPMQTLEMQIALTTIQPHLLKIIQINNIQQILLNLLV
jgi:hypothetical protein